MKMGQTLERKVAKHLNEKWIKTLIDDKIDASISFM